MALDKAQALGIPGEIAPDKTEAPAPKPGLTDEEIVQILETYRYEAEYARLAGPNSRDQTWLMNLDLYWNRYDFSKKAPWQAREVMPELPQYVDRFAAAMREALVSSERFFTVKVENDQENDIADVIRKFMGVLLRRIARSPSGHPVDFLSVFEEIMKFGALAMNAAVIIPKWDGKNVYIGCEPVDPYNIFLDPTGRGLYRIRRIEMDMHELRALAAKTDDHGKFLYNKDNIDLATAAVVALMRAEREKRTGTGQWLTSNRKPVILHEYLCTLVDNEGEVRGENVLCVVANNQFLIRGPEKNPFWHGRDWLITSPIITVPLSPYGRGYVENFASIVKTFNELTNLLLDGVFTSAMKAFAVVPSMLEDPSQIDEGVYPNVVFRLQEGAQVAEFLKEVDLGSLPQDALGMWQALKKEMQEGAAFNEISLGNLAPKGRTSATEIGSAEQNSSSFIRSIARNIEVLFLEPMLDVLWKTALQHLSKDDGEMKDALGDEWFSVLLKARKKFAKYRVTFVVRGISSLVLKQQKLQGVMQLMQTVQGNPLLLQKFMQEVDMGKLLNLMFDLLDVEKDRLELSPREKLIAQLQQQNPMAAGMVGAAPGTTGMPGMQPTQGPQPSAGAGGGQRVPAGGGAPAAARQGTANAGGGQ